jgi:uncharacterized membrane protein YphA (DoxX/SURF4 family)
MRNLVTARFGALRAALAQARATEGGLYAHVLTGKVNVAITSAGTMAARRMRITEMKRFSASSAMSGNGLYQRASSLARRVVSSRAVYFVALLGLCAAYLQGGINKTLDFDGAIAEVRQFGLEPAALMAIATIITELCGSALILTGVLRWLGALWLATFTLLATFIANRFWELPGSERFMVENAFFEHLGLVGGFLLVAWHDVLKRYG